MNRNESAFVASVVLVVALSEERDYFHKIILESECWRDVPDYPSDSFKVIYANKEGEIVFFIYTLAGMGPLHAMLGATSAMSAHSPNLVVMVGIAGSLDPFQVKLGDVIVTGTAKLYAPDKVAELPTNQKNEPDYDVYPDVKHRNPPRLLIDGRDIVFGDSYLRYQRDFVKPTEPMSMLISELEAALKRQSIELMKPDLANVSSSQVRDLVNKYGLSDSACSVHFGPILGSEKVIDSFEFRNYIVEKDQSDLTDVHIQKGNRDRCRTFKGTPIAVDMESFGMLKAVELATSGQSCYPVKTVFGGLVIRGISDLAEGKSGLDDDTKDGVRKVAVVNATIVLTKILDQISYRSLRTG